MGELSSIEIVGGAVSTVSVDISWGVINGGSEVTIFFGEQAVRRSIVSKSIQDWDLIETFFMGCSIGGVGSKIKLPYAPFHLRIKEEFTLLRETCLVSLAPSEFVIGISLPGNIWMRENLNRVAMKVSLLR